MNTEHRIAAAGSRLVRWVPPLSAIVGGAAILQLAHGLLGVIVPLNLGLAETPTFVIGLVVTAYSIGFLLGCLLAPAVIAPIGHIRAFAALAALYAVTTLLFAAGSWPAVWAVLRFINGFCAAGLFTVIESWVAEQAPAGGRGRVLAVYMVVNKVGLMVGQAILALGDQPGVAFFMLACGCTTFAIVPVSLARTGVPAARTAATLSLARLYRIAPIGVVGCFGAGLVNASVLGLGPVYGLQKGLAVAAVPLLIVAAQFGTMVLQWPLGWISDRTDRRFVIVLATAGGALVALATALTGARELWLLFGLFGLWGGFGLSVYALCISHASDFVEPPQLVPLVSSLMLSWAVGSIIGPNLAAAAMEWLGPDGLLYYVAVVSAVVGLFAAWRITRRRPVPPEARDAFVNVPATSPVAAELMRDGDGEEGKAGEGTGAAGVN